DFKLGWLYENVRCQRVAVAAERRAREPSAAVAERHVHHFLAGLELDVADAERLARDDGLGEAVGILDELVLPDDRRLPSVLPRLERRLDVRIVRTDQLAGR